MVFFGVQKVDKKGAPLGKDNYFKLPTPGEYELTPELAAKLNVCFCDKRWRSSLYTMMDECKRLKDDSLYWLTAQCDAAGQRWAV